jgi:FkbM family methyltransferase
MPSRFSKYNTELGFINALKLYKCAKAKVNSKIQFSFLQHPVFLRNIYSDIAIFEQIFIDKEYNVDIAFTPKTIIDLGANVGFASLYFNTKYPTAQIVAVEPEPNNFLQAKKNVEHYKNITLLNGAIWHNNDTLFLVDNGLGEAGFMVNDGKGTIEIKAFTIPNLMEIMNANIIDILKIDIEGAEKEIFENNTDLWLPKTKIVIVETHDRYRKGTSKAVFSAMNKYDFSLTLSGENLIFTNNNLF